MILKVLNLETLRTSFESITIYAQCVSPRKIRLISSARVTFDMMVYNHILETNNAIQRTRIAYGHETTLRVVAYILIAIVGRSVGKFPHLLHIEELITTIYKLRPFSYALTHFNSLFPLFFHALPPHFLTHTLTTPSSKSAQVDGPSHSPHEHTPSLHQEDSPVLSEVPQLRHV
jgi:hypothetical protein